MIMPHGYEWLGELGQLPRVIIEGLPLVGVKELSGAANSPQIMSWANEVGKDVSAVYGADSIPWCGLFAAVVIKRAGYPVVSGPLWAANWAKFGGKQAHAMLGDILVFKRDGGGHVGFYIGEDSTAYHVLGGNQSDAVTITRILKPRCVAVRRPFFKIGPPSSIRKYRIAANVSLSHNEA